jgi:hypothetical protein
MLISMVITTTMIETNAEFGKTSKLVRRQQFQVVRQRQMEYTRDWLPPKSLRWSQQVISM